MKKMIAALALGLGLIAPAHASFVVTDIGASDDEPVPGGNDFQALLAGEGFTQLFISVGVSLTEAATVDFYAYASESSFTNHFETSGTSYDEPGTDLNPPPVPFPGTLFGSQAYGAGAMSDLSFKVLIGGGVDAMIGSPGFGVITVGGYDGSSATYAAGDTIVFAFDDNGAGPDDNHDDLIIVAKIRSVIPEPATWGLMILGFAGLGAMTRRRSVARA